jgi:hypothetical protein
VSWGQACPVTIVLSLVQPLIPVLVEDRLFYTNRWRNGGTWAFQAEDPLCRTSAYQELLHHRRADAFTTYIRTNCSDTSYFVVFPTVPVLTNPANTCNVAFALPAVPNVNGFIREYSIDGAVFTSTPVIPTTPGCHSIVARYVTASACGDTPAGTPGTGVCAQSLPANVVIFPLAPTITAPANTCASAFIKDVHLSQDLLFSTILTAVDIPHTGCADHPGKFHSCDIKSAACGTILRNSATGSKRSNL